MARPRKEPDVFLIQDDLFITNKADYVDSLHLDQLDKTVLLDCASELALRQIHLVLKDSMSKKPLERRSVAEFVFSEHQMLEYYCLSLLIHMRGASAGVPLDDDVRFLGFAANDNAEEPEVIIMKGIVRCVADNLCKTAEEIVAAQERESCVICGESQCFEYWVQGMAAGMTGMPYLYDDVKALADGRLPYDFFASNKKTRMIQ